jgi:hypothetical protein
MRVKLVFNSNTKTYAFVDDDTEEEYEAEYLEIHTMKGVYYLRTLPSGEQTIREEINILDYKEGMTIQGAIWFWHNGVHTTRCYNPVRQLWEHYGDYNSQTRAIEIDILNWILAQPPQKDQLQLIHEAERENVEKTFTELGKVLDKEVSK